MLKRVINKKAFSGNDCKTDYGDATISSDENSDCCSEPSNETEDLTIDTEPKLQNNKEAVLNECDQNSFGKNNLSKASRNLEFTSLIRPSENISGSLQNVHEIKTEVRHKQLKIVNLSYKVILKTLVSEL